MLDTKKVMVSIVAAIDWDFQDCSRYFIGEDAAESLLSDLGFSWEDGVCNETVLKFLKTLGES